MGYFIIEATLFALGLLAFLFGRVPLSRRRIVRGSAARLVGAVLMIPLVLYLVACKRSNVAPLGTDRDSLDPLMPVTEGFVRLVAVSAALASLLAATVLAIISSELRPRKDMSATARSGPPESPMDRPDRACPDPRLEDRSSG